MTVTTSSGGGLTASGQDGEQVSARAEVFQVSILQSGLLL